MLETTSFLFSYQAILRSLFEQRIRDNLRSDGIVTEVEDKRL